MVPFLKNALERHGVRTFDDYRAKHEQFMTKKQAKGERYTVHESADPVEMRVDGGEWLVDCECGAGNSGHPDWPEVRCFGCGAVHTNVVWPESTERDAIETLLTRRQKLMDRAWWPGEAVEALQAENADLQLSTAVQREAKA